ncbi:MAG: hypothetical protein ACRDAM_08685, partial [Casimicrobium sp.]
MNEHVSSDDTSAERVAESDGLRHVSAGEWRLTSPRQIGDMLFVCEIHTDEMKNMTNVYARTADQALANARLMAAAKDMA